MNGTQAVVVGAGHAGAAAAIEMRSAGFEGRILLIGEETHLPYERPPLSKDQLLTPGADPVWLHEQAVLDAAGVELHLGRRVTAIDRAAARLQLDHGPAIAFDQLLMATGGIARTLPIPGGEYALTLRTLDDARRLRAGLKPGLRVAIVGAGVIGLEIASSAMHLGCEVLVLEQQAGPMARSLEPVMQGYIVDLHRAHHVELEFDAGLVAIEPSIERAYALHLADGSVRHADIVVAGIGLKPAISLAQDVALATSEGIVVDAYGVTSDANIRAAGDATSFFHPELGRHVHWQTWQHAQNHGKSVARNMAGHIAAYAPPFWFWTDQHGVNIQVTGFPSESDRTVLRGAVSDARFAAFHLRDGALVGATLVNNGGLVRPAQALIRAASRLDPAALADPGVPLQKLARN